MTQTNNDEVREIKRRRTGETLRDAIFQATWDELHESGYLGLRMDNIADRCRTSKAVLYRHYETKENLVAETIRWHLPSQLHYPLPNNGNLRADVLEFLNIMSKFIGPTTSHITLLFMNNYHSDLVDKLPYVDFDGRSASDALKQILVNAAERGDIRRAAVPESVWLMPLNALRNRALTNSDGPVEEDILEIVDQLYLPVIDFHANRRQYDEKLK